MEEPLLSDTDWAYDLADYGSMDKALGKVEVEQGKEASEAIGDLETGVHKGK